MSLSFPGPIQQAHPFFGTLKSRMRSIDAFTVHSRKRHGQAIRASILKLYHQPELRKQMGAHGRQRVLKQFSYSAASTKRKQRLRDSSRQKSRTKHHVVDSLPLVYVYFGIHYTYIMHGACLVCLIVCLFVGWLVGWLVCLGGGGERSNVG